MKLKQFFIVFLVGILFSFGANASLSANEADIALAIKKEFVDRGYADNTNIELELFSGQTNFLIDGAQDVKVLINQLKVDENLGRFSCEAEIFADRQSVAKSPLQGKYFLLAKVWVPAQNVAKGETLTEDMLKTKAIRKSRLKPFMVTEKEKLVGLEAQRSLREGKIITEKDVGAKILVKRNDVVLAVYRTDRMQITAKAIAQQDGAFGQRIELQNIKTHKLLTGVVQDASTVVIDN